MRNKTNNLCKGCKYYNEIDFYGGDMPSVHYCTNVKFCIKLSKYEHTIKNLEVKFFE